MNISFWRKKKSTVPPVRPIQPVPSPRCFVKEILKDLEDESLWTEVGIYFVNKKKKYKLYIGDCPQGNSEGSIYVSLIGVNTDEMNFTKEERHIVGKSVFSIINSRRRATKREAIQKDEDFLKKTFPKCYNESDACRIKLPPLPPR